MSSRFHWLAVSGAAFALVAFIAAPVLAQEPTPPGPPLQGLPPGAPQPPLGEQPKRREPPANLPRVQHGDAKNNLDKLFEALKVAPTDESAKYVENRIWALW